MAATYTISFRRITGMNMYGDASNWQTGMIVLWTSQSNRTARLRAVSHGKPTSDRLFRLVPVRRRGGSGETADVGSFSVWATTPCSSTGVLLFVPKYLYTSMSIWSPPDPIKIPALCIFRCKRPTEPVPSSDILR